MQPLAGFQGGVFKIVKVCNFQFFGVVWKKPQSEWHKQFHCSETIYAWHSLFHTTFVAILQCSQKVSFRPETGKIFFSYWCRSNLLKTPSGIDWSQKVLDFYHFGEILDLFRGGNLLFWGTVYNLLKSCITWAPSLFKMHLLNIEWIWWNLRQVEKMLYNLFGLLGCLQWM